MIIIRYRSLNSSYFRINKSHYNKKIKWASNTWNWTKRKKRLIFRSFASTCIGWKKKNLYTLSKAQGLWTLGSFFCCWLLEASIAIEAALCDAGRSCDDIDGGGGWGVGPETGLPELHGALAPSHHSSHPRTPTEIFIIN